MPITWDPNKDQKNRRAHKLSFDLAQHVFEDPLCRTSDSYEENGELRYDTIGSLFGQTVVIVSHTIEWIDSVEHIRIISARKADSSERRNYESDPTYP
ncbi:BrnT family toxin [Dyella flagellata]|uniref:Membrane protein n=1 Tax=Dyella flagellata TaxID=1867833 RepID=A0ABQ5X969_9GAMM|nr:membrane protein [Dyella flagellata]